MALITDVEGMKRGLAAKIKTSVSEAVDPLKSDMYDLKQRTSKLEQAPAATASSKVIADLQNAVNRRDPALRRIAFVGWQDDATEDTRTQVMEEFCRSYVPHVRTTDCS